MYIFRQFFSFEMKRQIRVRNLVLFLIVCIIVILLSQDGLNNFLDVTKNKNSFQEIEEKKVSQYLNYTYYGYYGITIMYIPLPSSILINDFLFDDMVSNVNTGDRLDIYKPLKGRNFFIVKSGYLSVLGIILLLVVLFGLVYGNDTVENKGYMAFINSISSPRKIFTAIILSRIIILSLAFLLLEAISVAWILINNVKLPIIPLAFISLLIILVLSFFFSIGCIIGTIKNKSTIVIVLASVFFCSVIIMPWLSDKLVRLKASDIEPLYNFELANQSLIMSMERRLIDKFGISKSGIAPPEILDAIEDALKREHRMLQEREDRMKNSTLQKIKFFQSISKYFPVLFYFSSCKEICGQGGLSYVDFYSNCQKRKAEFTDFYVEKKFKSEFKPGQIENFVKKGEENIFYAESKIPEMFWQGAIITLIYTIIGLIIAYFLSKRQLFAKPEFKDRYDLVDLKLKTGKVINVTSYKDDLAHQIINPFLGKIQKGFNGKISIDGKSIINEEKEDVVIVPGYDQMPGDIQAGAFLTLIGKMSKAPEEEINQQKQAHENILKKRFYKLEPHQISSLLVAAAELKKSKANIFRNFCAGIPGNKAVGLVKRLEALKEQGALVLDILKDNLYYMKTDFCVSYIFEEELSKYINPSDLRKMEEQEEEELD